MKEKLNPSKIGVLVVITGASGAGKDTVVDEIFKHNVISTYQIQRVVTNTDRPRRDGEPSDSYHFVNPDDLNKLESENLLVEPITQTGLSRKATSKAEIARLLSGEHLLWRIDPSRAAEIATGNFFTKNFPEYAKTLNERTLVICINAPKETIENRRISRDGQKYNPKDYEIRDRDDQPHLDILLEKAVVVENLDDNQYKTVENVSVIIANHHAKVKNKKV